MRLQIGRAADTNWLGGARVRDIPPGTYTVVVRKPGCSPLVRMVEFKPATRVDQQFEERRRAGFGTFIDAEEIAGAQGKSLATLLQAKSSGINIKQGSRAGAMYLGASRGVATIGALPRADPFDPQSPRGCWVAVYLDGHRIFTPSTIGQQSAPNLNDYDLTTLQGIEFYKGGATTPPELGGTGAMCGTLVLWTRDK